MRVYEIQNEFSTYHTHLNLKHLALQPVDLTDPHVLTPERLSSFVAEGCGYKLLYGTERIDEGVLLSLTELAQEARALEKMTNMQDGAIVNQIEGYPSEQRPALHTATRDFFESPRSASSAKKAAESAKKEIDKLRNFIDKIDAAGQFNELVTIGIGGSDLGPRATYLALKAYLKPGRKVHFISNVDPDDAAAVLKEVKDLKKTLVVVISKSGTTLETAVNEELVAKKFREVGLNLHQHFIAITQPGTPLDNHEKYLEVFHIWDWIGGRYSTTSMVGAVTLAFAFGFDLLWEFLKGAHAMDRLALKTDIKQNLPLLSALLEIWNHNYLNLATSAFIPYAQPLHRFPAHIQQVAMESNGKSIDKHGKPVNFQTCPIVWGEPGTNAQHSFFQLLHQGTSPAALLLVAYKHSQRGDDTQVQGTTSQEKLLANVFAQSLALASGQVSDNPNKLFTGNRPSSILLGEKLTPFALGALLAFFEHKVAFEGFIWDINSFDQEGVELGKGLAKKIISCFASQRKGEEETSYPLGDAYLKHLANFR